MAENDLSRIVGLIMENPRLVEEIKGLAMADKKGNEEKSNISEEILPKESEEKSIPTAANATYSDKSSDSKVRRKDLLMALKPYVSEERGRAIESMMSIADIIEMMRSR